MRNETDSETPSHEDTEGRRPGGAAGGLKTGSHDTSRLTRIALYSEVIASMAVVVTLIFLIAEVRQNTAVTQAAAFERRMEDLNDWRSLLITEPDMAELYIDQVAEAIGEPLDTDDVRLAAYLNMQWSIYENAYFANERGLLGESEWGRFENQICNRYTQEGDGWDEGTFNPVRLLTEEFVEFVEATCP